MGDPFVLVNETYLEITKWKEDVPNIVAGFTTRKGGVSTEHFASLNCGFHVHDEKEKVVKNRRILAEKIDFPLENWVSGEQVHGTQIRVVTEDDRGKGAFDYKSAIKQIDGIIAAQKGILCTAFFADCVPLYFIAPQFPYVGIAHAGWRGTVNQIGKRMVEHFHKLGFPPEELYVAIGPCISQQFYEVDEKVIQHIDPRFFNSVVNSRENNRFLLDLQQLNIDILLQSGVIRHNIEVTSFCTFHDAELFFSHRRDRGKTGRMLGFIGLLP